MCTVNEKRKEKEEVEQDEQGNVRLKDPLENKQLQMSKTAEAGSGLYAY